MDAGIPEVVQVWIDAPSFRYEKTKTEKTFIIIEK
jgi:hypothetical protein